jgi:hypothetical protein
MAGSQARRINVERGESLPGQQQPTPGRSNAFSDFFRSLNPGFFFSGFKFSIRIDIPISLRPNLRRLAISFCFVIMQSSKQIFWESKFFSFSNLEGEYQRIAMRFIIKRRVLAQPGFLLFVL